MADDVIGRPRLELEATRTKLDADLKAAQAAVGAAMSKAEKVQAQVNKQIQANIDRINAVRPTAQMQLLSQAIERMGGVSKLSEDKVARLRGEVERLAAAGAKVPKSLQSVTGGGLGAGQAALTAAQQQLAAAGPGGLAGAGLAALGPAGLAAAAGIGALAIGVTAASKAIGALLDRADQLSNLSSQLQISAVALQGLEQIAKPAGVSLESLGTSVLKLTRNLELNPQAFARYGLDIERLKGLAPDKLFLEVAESIREMDSPGQQAAAVMQLLGDRSGETLKVIRQGATDIRDLGFLTDEQVARLDALGDEWGRLGDESKNAALQFTDAGLNTIGLDSGLKDVTNTISMFSGLIRDNQATVREWLNEALLGLPKLLAGFQALEEIELPDVKSKMFQPGVAGEIKLPDAEEQVRLLERGLAAERAATAKAEAAQKEALAKRELALHRQNMAATDAILAKEREIDAITKRQIENLTDQLRTQQAIARAAQEEFNARARSAGTSENESMLRQRIVEAKASMDGSAAEAKKTAEIIDDMTAKMGAGGREWNRRLKESFGLLQETEKPADRVAEALAQAAHFSEIMGVNADTFAGRMTSAMPALGAAFQAFSNATHATGRVQTIGGSMSARAAGMIGAGANAAQLIGGVIGGTAGRAISGAGAGAAMGMQFGPWGAAAGAVVGGLVGLFTGRRIRRHAQEAGRVLGRQISDEAAQEIERRAKETGRSFSQVVADMKKEEEKAKADAKRAATAEGLGRAQSGLEALFSGLEKLKRSPELDAFAAAIETKVGDALLKAGLGFMATGALKTSVEFGAAQTAAGGAAEVMAGMRQAGMVDTGLTTAMGGLATELQRQAMEAALATGMTQEEAQKAGFGAVSNLLREQLNASIQSGTELDANTKALIEEAKANDITILADPAIESLAVQRQQLDVLKNIAGQGGPEGDTAARKLERAQRSGQLLPDVSARQGVGPVLTHQRGFLEYHPDEFMLVAPRNQFENLLLSVPAMLKDRGSLRSAARGMYEPMDLPGYDDDSGPGGGDAVGGGGGLPGTDIQALMDAMPGLIAQAVAAAPPSVEASLNVVQNLTEDPLQTQERREDMRRFTSRLMAQEVRAKVGDFYSALYETIVRARR